MSKPDFTGTWQFNPGKSRLQIPAPDASVFRIEHHEPDFHLERTHTFGGATDTFSIDLTTDGRRTTINLRGMEVSSRLFWDGNVLVFDSVLRQGSEGGANIVRYQLGDGGRELTALEQMSLGDNTHTNTWVFDRQG